MAGSGSVRQRVDSWTPGAQFKAAWIRSQLLGCQASAPSSPYDVCGGSPRGHQCSPPWERSAFTQGVSIGVKSADTEQRRPGSCPDSILPQVSLVASILGNYKYIVKQTKYPLLSSSSRQSELHTLGEILSSEHWAPCLLKAIQTAGGDITANL